MTEFCDLVEHLSVDGADFVIMELPIQNDMIHLLILRLNHDRRNMSKNITVALYPGRILSVLLYITRYQTVLLISMCIFLNQFSCASLNVLSQRERPNPLKLTSFKYRYILEPAGF